MQRRHPLSSRHLHWLPAELTEEKVSIPSKDDGKDRLWMLKPSMWVTPRKVELEITYNLSLSFSFSLCVSLFSSTSTICFIDWFYAGSCTVLCQGWTVDILIL